MPKDVSKGQFYAARYKGTGGDLILGEVQSVRTSGHIVLTNLLTRKTATKKIDVLMRRNKRISKRQAAKILAAFKKGGRDAARKAAIAAPEFRNGREQLQLPPAPLNVNKSIEELLEGLGCKIESEAGIWTVETPEGETWDFTTPQKKEKPEPKTKIIVWGSWETVENFGTADADYLSDGEALCLGAFDTIEEAENYIQTLTSERHLIEGCPGV